MAYGIIYRAFDTTNGKSYVGQTVRTLENRKKGHLSPKSGCVRFRNALLKRAEAFVWTVLAECETQQELDEVETRFGENFNCLAPNGYNLKLGRGNGRLSQEMKDAISRGRTGRRHSPETRQKMREARLKRWSDPEFRQQMSEKNRQMWQDPVHRKKMEDAGFRPDIKKGKRYLRKG